MCSELAAVVMLLQLAGQLVVDSVEEAELESVAAGLIA